MKKFKLALFLLPIFGLGIFLSTILSQTQAQAGNTPVVFIPGMMGTRLVATANFTTAEGQPYDAGDEVWGSEVFAIQSKYFGVELTAPNGEARNYPVDVPGRNPATGNRQLNVNPALLSLTFLGIPVVDVHNRTISQFTDAGYNFGQDLFVFGWDWRKGAGQKYGNDPNDPHGNYVTVKELDQMIDQIITQTGKPRVHIVGHSQGGYVAWFYLSKHQNKVQTLTTLGTPYAGSPKITAGMLWGVRDYKKGDYGPTPATIRRISRTMPGAAETLPPASVDTYLFDNAGDFGFGPRQFTALETLGLLRAQLTGDGDPRIIDHARNFHQEFRAVLQARAGVKVRVIIGSGFKSYEQLFTKKVFVFPDLNLHTQRYYRSILGGDKTVPFLNARATGLVPAPGDMDIKFYYTKSEHLALTQAGVSMQIVLNIVQPNRKDLQGVDPTKVNVTNFPPRKSVEIQINSPLNLHVYDGSGNHTGLDSFGLPEEGIPDSDYDEIGQTGSKTISLPPLSPGQTYEIKLESLALSEDRFDLAVTTISDGGIISQMILYLDVPVYADTLVFPPLAQGRLIWDGTNVPSNVPSLEVDLDNDGVFDTEVPPTITNGADDTDKDGLLDGEEMFYFQTLPNNSDTDGDGLNDGHEVENSCLNPLVDDAALDPDGDGLDNLTEFGLGTNPCNDDTDGDGCTDGKEVGPDPNQGGGRNPLNKWDFFDVPTGPSLTKDKAVTGADIFAVVARFGSNDDGGFAEINHNTDPFSIPPPAPAYHPAYDRTAAPGKFSGPPDGTIGGGDIFLTVLQFGHTCIF